MSRIHTRRTVAVHEAGHAVIAQLQGDAYGAAVFQSAEHGLSGLAGFGALETPFTGFDWKSHYNPAALSSMEFHALLAEATIYAAGCVAEAVDKSLLNYDLVFVDGQDSLELTAIAQTVMGKGAGFFEEQAFRKLAIARAWRMLSAIWYIVQAVAGELEQRGRLTAGEVADIMKRTREAAEQEQAAMFPTTPPRKAQAPENPDAPACPLACVPPEGTPDAVDALTETNGGASAQSKRYCRRASAAIPR